MKIKDKIIKEMESLPDDKLGDVLKFVQGIERSAPQKRVSEESQWSRYALGSGSFDFWLDDEEVEYTLADLKERA